MIRQYYVWKELGYVGSVEGANNAEVAAKVAEVQEHATEVLQCERILPQFRETDQYVRPLIAAGEVPKIAGRASGGEARV
jgi:hypothetical protein